MSQSAVYGAVVSVPIVVQLELPAGARSKTTCWTSVSVSVAVAESGTVPETGVPGFAGYHGVPLWGYQVALIARAGVLVACLLAWVLQPKERPPEEEAEVVRPLLAEAS